MKIQEDPWDNYLYYDSKYLLPLICHTKSLSIEEQVVIVLFLQHTSQDGTISQFKTPSQTLIADLIAFLSKADDDDDEPVSLIDKVRNYCTGVGVAQETSGIETLYADLNRAFRMFYLKQQMLGKLKKHKEDYFV